jgi:hypothetical protein
MAQTRQLLLENFDEEVHDRLKLRKEEAAQALDRRTEWLLALCSELRIDSGTDCMVSSITPAISNSYQAKYFACDLTRRHAAGSLERLAAAITDGRVPGIAPSAEHPAWEELAAVDASEAPDALISFLTAGRAIESSDGFGVFLARLQFTQALSEALRRRARSLMEIARYELRVDANSLGKGALRVRFCAADDLWRYGPMRELRRNSCAFHHRLGSQILARAMERGLPPGELHFRFSGSGGKSSESRHLWGEKGWLLAWKVSFESTYGEEHLFATGITDQGRMLDDACATQMIHMPARVAPAPADAGIPPESLITRAESGARELRDEAASPAAALCADEMANPDRIADSSLTGERQIKELDGQIRSLWRTRKMLTTPQQNEISDATIADLRNRRRLCIESLLSSRNDAAMKREALIQETEAAITRLMRPPQLTELFRVRWSFGSPA